MERIILQRIAKAFVDYITNAKWQDNDGWLHWPKCPACGSDGHHHAKNCHIGIAFEDACKIVRMQND